MKRTIMTVVLLSLWTPSSWAQTCLHGTSEQPNQRARRDQALVVAQRINMAQSVVSGPRTGRPTYRPLGELVGVPPTPRGFALRFHTDGESYAFSLKDSLDPCGYAIFSDDGKQIYEALPRVGPMVVPAS